MQDLANSPRPSAASRAVIVTLVGLAAVACFFRVPILSGFSHLFGDAFDGRIETTILEHWFAVLRGYEPWNRVAYFYPVPDSLGYNDGYLLYGLLHSGFRALGVDPFLSSEFVNLCVHFAGFVFFVLFARRVAALPFGLSLLGATVFTLADSLYVQTGQSGHVQLFAVSFTPLLGLLGWDCARALRRGAGVRAALAGGGAALLYGAWLLTGYYMAWFTTLFGCLLGLAAGAIWLATKRQRPPLRRFAPAVLWPLPVIALVLVLSLLPFLWVYLPKARETGMHPVAAMMAFSPSLLDLVHFGPDNYLFGWLDRAITAGLRPGFPTTGEHVIGFTPVLLVLALAGAVLAWRGPASRVGPVIFWRALSLAFLASLVIVVHVGSHTIWLLVYEHVPGAGAVRTVTRYVLLLLVPGTLLAMLPIAALLARWRSAAVVLGAVLVLEQFSGADPAHLDRAAQLRALAAMPAAPAACRSFFLRDPEAKPDMDFGRILLANIDAMMVAELRHVPTLNGAASFHPEGDDLLFIQEPGYLSRVGNTVHRYGIAAGLCAFDPTRKAWMTQAFPKIDATPGRMVMLGTDAGEARAALSRLGLGRSRAGRRLDHRPGGRAHHQRLPRFGRVPAARAQDADAEPGHAACPAAAASPSSPMSGRWRSGIRAGSEAILARRAAEGPDRAGWRAAPALRASIRRACRRRSGSARTRARSACM